MKIYPCLNGWAVIVTVLLSGILRTSAAVPQPEHPRPDQQRENWMTLNGEWQFEIDQAADGDARGLERFHK
jgi:hypothetical protein